jgi:DNA-binding MarR family transcriptional regulator
VTKRLDRLESAQLLERHPDPHDRRGVLIKLTQTGLDLIDRAVVAITLFESGVVSGAIGSDDERLQLESALRRMLVEHERGLRP